MGSRKLDQYKGRLSPAQIAEGINAAQRNASRLVEDAKLLQKAGRWASAVALAILAIEESGKTSILRHLSLARDEKEVSKRWREFRSHTKKNAMWIIGELFSGGARRLDDFLPVYQEDAEHPHLLDQLKQISFYTDCLGKAHWSEPAEISDEALAKAFVTLAARFGAGNVVTEKEIELWLKHLGPVWMKDTNWMKKALENWYSDMQTAGLAPAGPNKMEDWIRHGIIHPRDKSEA